MGCHGDALELSWHCHASAFDVSLETLGVSWGAFERLIGVERLWLLEPTGS